MATAHVKRANADFNWFTDINRCKPAIRKGYKSKTKILILMLGMNCMVLQTGNEKSHTQTNLLMLLSIMDVRFVMKGMNGRILSCCFNF